MLGAGVAGSAATAASASTKDANSISDSAILNFALNLEYLEGEFYSFAVHGHGLPASLTHGTGQRGPVIGGRAVPFRTRAIRQFAAEIARDELDHVAVPARRAGLRGGGPADHQHPARASPPPRSRPG